MKRIDGDWQNISSLTSFAFVCGYCGHEVASEKGYFAHNANWSKNVRGIIYVCHHCNRPSFFDLERRQYPGAAYGPSVKDIGNESIEKIYEEARNSIGCNAFTATVLCCRKLLMHIAVSKGAVEGKNFIEYVEFLADQHYIPPGAKEWVDHIRKRGNEANHEIVVMGENDAKELVDFIGMLLKNIYEFPAAIRRKSGSDLEE